MKTHKRCGADCARFEGKVTDKDKEGYRRLLLGNKHELKREAVGIATKRLKRRRDLPANCWRLVGGIDQLGLGFGAVSLLAEH